MALTGSPNVHKHGLFSEIDVVDAARLCFIFAACTTLAFFSIPFLNDRFVNYGARSTHRNHAVPTQSTGQKKTDPSVSSHKPGIFSQMMDWLATWQVPHRYFTHYYAFALLSSAFWISQLLTRGAVFNFIVSNMSDRHLQKSMTIHQVALCIALVVAQAGRRLYESIALAKPSSSRMWFVLWWLGLFFYGGITTALWIEGSGSILSSSLTVKDLRLSQAPSLRTFLCLPVFLIASGVQHDCHQYLSSLKGYSVPSHPLFQQVICPHYTAECVIYLALSFLAAPIGDVINKTVLCGFFFVIINLGVTAQNTTQWYKAKFGEDSVRGKWKMIPGLF